MFAAKVIKNNPSRNDVDEFKFMATITNQFILGAVECFINIDYTDYTQLIIITELAQYDLE